MGLQNPKERKLMTQTPSKPLIPLSTLQNLTNATTSDRDSKLLFVDSIDTIKLLASQYSKHLEFSDHILSNKFLDLLTTEIVDKINNKYLDVNFVYIPPLVKVLTFLNSFKPLNTSDLIIILTILLDDNVNVTFTTNKDTGVYQYYVNKIYDLDVDEPLTIQPSIRYGDFIILDKLYKNISIKNKKDPTKLVNNVVLYHNGVIVNNQYKINSDINLFFSYNKHNAGEIISLILLNDVYKQQIDGNEKLIKLIAEAKLKENSFTEQATVYSESIKNNYLNRTSIWYQPLKEYCKLYPELDY